MAVNKYSTMAVILHWVMAIMILAMIGLGVYMVDLPKGSDERSAYFALHKSIGLTLALLALIRLGWKITHAAPPLPDSIDAGRRKLITATHHLLYVLMIVQPLSGYISSSFSGYKTRFWGIPLPNWGWKAPELNELFTTIHDVSAFCLVTLLVLHIGGAISHAMRREHEITRRMWF